MNTPLVYKFTIAICSEACAIVMSDFHEDFNKLEWLLKDPSGQILFTVYDTDEIREKLDEVTQAIKASGSNALFLEVVNTDSGNKSLIRTSIDKLRALPKITASL